MAMNSLPSVRFNTQLMTEDMAAKGWEIKDLAAQTSNISLRTAYRFFTGELQTIRTARSLAAVLGQPIDRYLIRASDSAEAVAS